MRVLLTINALDPAEGGTTAALLALASALAGAGADARIATLRAASPGPPDIPVITLPRTADAWRRVVADDAPDVVHDHGLWLRSNRLAARAAAGQAPRVVSTHGMLSPWALGHHAWRKRVAWLAFQRRDLASAAVVHATSEAEAADVRAAGVQGPVEVVPHGVRVPPARAFRPAAGPRTALFLGRLHEVKGLPALIDAWAASRPAGWELLIAGPDPDSLRPALERQRDDAGIADAVRFEGYLSSERRDELLASADLFVLPSLSENFGVAVAEALAAGLPVIVSDRAPWAVVAEVGAGWSVAPEAGALAAALRRATSIPPEDRRAMGERGRALVERDFAWPAVAARMLALYARAAGREG